MYSLLIKLNIARQVCKSTFACIVGYIWSRVTPQSNLALSLVGSNYGDSADPNAYQIIQELQRQDKPTFLVVNKSNQSNTLQRGSLTAAYYFFCSKRCFYTHSLSDVIPHAHKLHFLKKILKFPQLVFLQHGVIGLKSVMSNDVLLKDYIISLEPTFDFMIVSSNNELILIEKFGVPKQKIAITGLPRFDSYHSSKNNNKTVLIFFTWQNEKNIKWKFEQIQSSSILEVFRKNEYVVKTASHNMQKKIIPELSLDSEELQKAIATCSLLITDDSSMAWDVLYRKQEVIFLSPSESWFSNDPFLFERRCFCAHELRDKVDAYIKSDGSTHDFVFADYYDNKNTQRVLALT